ncbi:MAG: NADH-quinone oxidoreductase subunit NuoE [Chloroflexota bacterium]
MLLSDETRTKILTEVRKYPQTRTALLPALKLAQAQVGWLPREAIAEVADLVGVSSASANELATFYSMLNTHHRVDVKVEVCVQLPCALRGADTLLEQLADGLGIQPGETTADGKIELHRTHECFGSCNRAPMCRLNDEYRENLTPEATRALIDELKAARGTNGRAVPPPAGA